MKILTNYKDLMYRVSYTETLIQRDSIFKLLYLYSFLSHVYLLLFSFLYTSSSTALNRNGGSVHSCLDNVFKGSVLMIPYFS